MGKGTDKLYITHSEWSSSDAYGANSGANVASAARGTGASFRRLPFNYCAASLQPFRTPVCTPDGTIFDVQVISAWLEKHQTNPANGGPLEARDLIRLHFTRNGEGGGDDETGDLIDPVTFKVFTDNTHIVAIKHGLYANVFAWETVDRMNIKAKIWRDLVDDSEFKRSDVITLQDPRNVASRDLNQFKFLRDGGRALAPNKKADASDAGPANVNVKALGRLGDKVLEAKSAVERARKEREAGDVNNKALENVANVANMADVADVERSNVPDASAAANSDNTKPPAQSKGLAFNRAVYTNGRAAASLTSTGLTPETSGERQILTDEEFLLKPRRVRTKGYARVETSSGDLVLELLPEHAPKAVWNWIRLAQKGFYDGLVFHRNIPGFMIQGGDPGGDGRGGQSIWNKYFEDELGGPLTHHARGVVSMANKGKGTNSSQFFITYQPAPHLDRKHTIFARVVEGMDVLAELESVPTDGSDRPLNKIVMKRVVVFLDPFQEHLAEQKNKEQSAEEATAISRRRGADDDEVTWTGKRIRDGTVVERKSGKVGKYLTSPSTPGPTSLRHKEEEGGFGACWEEPARKKARPSGFGNFDTWE